MILIRPIRQALLALALVAPLSAAPTVTTTTPLPDATVSSLTSVSITFSEAVAGVEAGDLTVNSEAAAAVTGTGRFHALLRILRAQARKRLVTIPSLG